jgi:hypothetical protein
VNAAVVALAGTVTEEGIVKTFGIAPERLTERPPEGAAAESVTVHEVLLLEVRLEAPHCKFEITVAVTSEIVAGAEEPLREAVTVAL